MLVMDNVQAYYRKKQILFDISLTFDPGFIHVIIGPNGCGKSTLLSLLGLPVATYSGDITLHHHPLSTYSAMDKAFLLGVLPQITTPPYFNVETLLRYGRYPHSQLYGFREEDERIFQEVIHQLQLAPYLKRELHTLSGGERQWVYLGLLMIQDPEIMIFDEPLTFLDLPHQFAFLDQIKRCKAQGKTIIMVVHDLLHALSIADYMVIMEKGQIKCHNKVDEILQTSIIEDVFEITLTKHHEGYIIERKKLL